VTSQTRRKLRGVWLACGAAVYLAAVRLWAWDWAWRAAQWCGVCERERLVQRGGEDDWLRFQNSDKPNKDSDVTKPAHAHHHNTPDARIYPPPPTAAPNFLFTSVLPARARPASTPLTSPVAPALPQRLPPLLLPCLPRTSRAPTSPQQQPHPAIASTHARRYRPL
jgi:4-amino-4-deoxy-L-arabinose transferase-like glycosyltransferase